MHATTLTEFSKKQVVNLCDGKLLGHVEDLVFDPCDGKLCAIVVPGSCGFSFRRGRDLRIPWCQIEKIGEDTILVDARELPPESEHRSRKEKI